MMLSTAKVLGSLAALFMVSAAESGERSQVFQHEVTASQLSYQTDSGLCETTPGVGQHSGYFNYNGSDNQEAHMFFWHFEARNNASTAPLVMWLGGGPGCSGLNAVFDGAGPCTMESGDAEPHVNPTSYNEYASMLYVDQPIGAGFSYGAEDYTSTRTAAPAVWKLLQAFYATFPEYQSRDFGIFSQSYGGHWGPAFLTYFQSQNAAIDASELEGYKINIVALGVNNGLFDYEIQFKGYVDYAYNNSYEQLVDEKKHAELTEAYVNQCLPQIEQCTDDAPAGTCIGAYVRCSQSVMSPIKQNISFDGHDIRQESHDNPPPPYIDWITSEDVMAKLGANSTFNMCGSDPFGKMFNSGDLARPFLDDLSELTQSGVNVFIWAGDADFTCNWRGCLDVANHIEYAGSDDFEKLDMADWTIDGKSYGQYKNVENLTFLKVYESGHIVTQYQPDAALAAFNQIMFEGKLQSS